MPSIRIPSIALILAVLAAGPVDATPCTGGSDAPGIAFDYASPGARLMVVEAAIEGIGPAAVVFDTGASAPFELFLAPTLAAKLDLPLSAPIVPATTTAIGATPQSYRTARLASFQLGPVALRDVAIAVVPMIDRMRQQIGRPVDAIVGQHFVRDRVIAIDYAGQRIDLAAPPGDPARAIGFTLASRKPLLLVEATVGGQGPFVLEIDTGATATTLSPAVAARGGIQPSGQGQMGGAGGPIAVQVGRARIGFAGLTRELEPIAISEAPAAIGAAAGSPVDGILGGDFFAGTCLTIDYPGHRLWLVPAGAP